MTRYYIDRASERDSVKKPCDEAYRVEIKSEYGSWWMIDIQNLDAIESLVAKYGDIVIRNDKTIIIYDDYLE